MHPARIVAELKVRGWSYKRLADACGVSDSAVYNSVYGRPFVSRKVRMKIALVLDVPVEEIWPERDLVAA